MDDQSDQAARDQQPTPPNPSPRPAGVRRTDRERSSTGGPRPARGESAPPPPPFPRGAPPVREIPPWQYGGHLQAEHGVEIFAEPGWPTERKKYRLVRIKEGKQQTLATYVGTQGEAFAHFYRMLHPIPAAAA